MEMLQIEYDGNDEDLSTADVMNHDIYRIALYYCYIPLSEDDVLNVVNFHTTMSKDNNNVHSYCFDHEFGTELGGRIRIAPEGLNGVLSGLLIDLHRYEEELRHLLLQIHGSRCNSEQQNTPIEGEWELDVKYCRLRTDLSPASQLFTQLQVQKTDTVVGLFDKDMIMSEYCDVEEVDADCINDSASDRVTKSTSQQQRRSGHRGKKQQRGEQDQQQKQHLEIIRTIYQTSFQIKNYATGQPTGAPHLSPDEWNVKLQQLVLQKSTIVTTKTNTAGRHNIVLLDCRNCYESSIGYFEVPGATTILTNTRKYSELPFVLMDQISDTDPNAIIEGQRKTTPTSILRNASHIFMYCTGGVRCERASAFLQAALMETSPLSSSHPLPQIYQLKGGIQRYLEHSNSGNNGSTSPCYYRGKNFVFDLRRTDPMTVGEHNSSNGVVGKCIVCNKPYDDYDQGYAPILHHETRCYKCRMLILVCPQCRTDVLCWGDGPTDEKRKIYCGNTICTGTRMEPFLMVDDSLHDMQYHDHATDEESYR